MKQVADAKQKNIAAGKCEATSECEAKKNTTWLEIQKILDLANFKYENAKKINETFSY
ncbi:hypothetical protein [Campylobacter sp.]|uniref:hypothetical protein n=1 Tax=Campylobacter sp. TaxID=205 RepID=UPI002AA68823|nr:hypothetical protein [Campylobacter sp.]MCI7582396.1 hypothetical protein [Campylobacter sp.]